MSLTYSLYGTLSDAVEKVFKPYPGVYEFKYPCTSRKECIPYEVKLSPGNYKIELWGANGGQMVWDGCTCNNNVVYGGLGGYTSAKLRVRNPKTYYLFIGGGGHDYPYSNNFNAFNGGGYSVGAAGGGGSTDIRESDEYSDNKEILKTRILIAGGGGGSDCNGVGGAGGGLIGGNATNGGKGGTQSEGGSGGIPGNLWHGAFGNYQSSAGGGGGYYGGGYGTSNENCGNGGGGGSSYASKDFDDVLLYHGDEVIPYPTLFEKGVNGAARISKISRITCCIYTISNNLFRFSYIFVII